MNLSREMLSVEDALFHIIVNDFPRERIAANNLRN